MKQKTFFEAEIKQAKAELKKYRQRTIKNSKRYEPSNSTEASIFYHICCVECSKDTENNPCEILSIFEMQGTHEHIRVRGDNELFCTASPEWLEITKEELLKCQ